MKRFAVVRSFHPILGWGSMIIDHFTRRRILITGERHEERALARVEQLEKRT